MIEKITKRDGTIVEFHPEKITNAIYKAAQAVGGSDYETALDLTKLVLKRIDDKYPDGIADVEGIQDEIEHVLISTQHDKTAKAFILYREERSRAREMNTRLMKTFEEIYSADSIDSDLLRDNANIDGNGPMGKMLKYASEGAKTFYDMFVMKKNHASAHRNGDMHIHDYDFYGLTLTCCQIDLKKLFTGGFSTGHGSIREPNSIAAYAALAAIAIQSNQNDQHGGQSLPAFDYHMTDGVKKSYIKIYRQNLCKALSFSSDTEYDVIEEGYKHILRMMKEDINIYPTIADIDNFQSLELDYLIKAEFAKEMDLSDVLKAQKFAKKRSLPEIDRETYQAMESFIHNLNTMHSRAGAQVPFSSINYGTDISEEGRLIIKNVLKATESGLGVGETPIFPIQIFKVKEGVNLNPGDPNYDLFRHACRCSAKRLFPNFSFIDAPYNLKYYKENAPETEVAYMGCRTRVLGNVVNPDKEIAFGRGNLSFSTINLPRLAIKANKDINKFYSLLDDMLNLTIDQLLERFFIQCKKKVFNFPFLMGQGVWIDSEKLKWDDTVEEVIRNGTMSCGFIGLPETLTELIGSHHGETEEAQKLGLEIVSHMRRRLDEEAERRKLNFTLLATPAEGLSGRFVRMDAKKYGIIEGVTDKEYYTNSFHIPVGYNISAFKKIELEAPYHALCNAGHITYVELDGDPSKNIDAFESIVRHMQTCGIGYGAINHPIDRDPVCGYNGIIDNTCPRCGRDENDGNRRFERIRRITGYLVGTLDRFNNGKRAEEADRVKHNI